MGTSAFVSFAFRQSKMMRHLSRRKGSLDPLAQQTPSGDAWHHDIMRYLGAMNGSLAALALLRLYAIQRASPYFSTGSSEGDIPLDITSLVVLGLANMSQAVTNFQTALSGNRWVMGRGLELITVLDAVFTILDLMAAVGKMSFVGGKQ